MTIAEHWVATTRGGDRSLLVPERAGWLWIRLRARFPEALSCVLMPDHVHLVLPPGQRDGLRRVLAAFAVRFHVRFDILAAQPAHTPAIAGRMIRYGYLNPVRAGLCADPFEWCWSTLRDAVAACAPIWTPVRRIARALQLDERSALRGLTRLAHRRWPTPRPTGIAVASIEQLGAAAGAALRLTAASELREPRARRLIVQLAFEIERPRIATLVEALGCSTRTIHRDRTPPHPALGPALRCLADPRLCTSPLGLRPSRDLADVARNRPRPANQSV